MAAKVEAECAERLEAQSLLGTVKVSENPAAADGDGGAFRKGGVLPTAILLAKAAIGAGVMSMSVHAVEVGLLYTIICLILGGGLTIVSVCMIAQASVVTGRWSFEDICEELFSPAMSFFTGFVNVCGCLGSAACYLIVCGQVFVVLSDAGEAERKVFVTLIGVLVCVPLALAPHLAFMRHLAAASVLSIFLLVVVVAFHVVSNGVDHQLTWETFWFGKGGANMFTYMNSINVISFAYNNQFNVPQLTGELTPQPTMQAMAVVGCISTPLVGLLYVAVSVMGVLAFGIDGQKDTLVLDLFPERHHPVVIVTNLAVIFSVLTCFQFHIYPIRQFCAYSIRKARGLPANTDKQTDQQLWGLSLTRWLDMACGVGSVLLALVIAVAVTELTEILEFIGAFAGSWLSFIVPSLFILQICRGRESFSWWSVEVVTAMVVLSFGAFFFVFGMYASIVG